MEKIIIEENIWNIHTKQPIRKCILTRDGNVLTRQLYNINDNSYRNNKTDTIDLTKYNLKINLMDAKRLSIQEIGEYIKMKAQQCNPEEILIQHLEKELPGFQNPNITKL